MSLKSWIEPLLRRYSPMVLYYLVFRSYLRDVGWFVSFRRFASIDREHRPIPWLTYSAIEFLSARVSANSRVFEYGAGNSTIWWGKHVREVVSAEHERSWIARIEKQLPKNAKIKPCDLSSEAFRSAILEEKELFDVVVIDGAYRNEVARVVTQRLKSGGIIVYDNSDLDYYTDGVRYLKEEEGFRELPFVGMAPISAAKSCTSILYKSENCLGI